jgi:hypothetical protein
MPKIPDQYKELINKAYIEFDVALQEMSKSYPDYKIDPTNKEYLTEYNLDQKNLETAKASIFSYRNQLEKDSNDIQAINSRVNKNITKLNNENAKLLRKLNTLENQNSGAEGELYDKEYIYNEIYIENIILLLVIFGGIILYTKRMGIPQYVNLSHLVDRIKIIR